MVKPILVMLTAVLALAAGCVQEPQKLEVGLERGDIRTEMVSFRTVKDVSDAVIGYIEEVRWREAQGSGWQPGAELFYVQYVYDDSFRQKGFISAQGEVRSYRQDIKGEVVNHGVMALSDGVKRILGIDLQNMIYFEQIEPMYKWEEDLKK
ncbi:MAG: hypothetical protein V1701_07725 [Planctomycetota bacterium]